MTDFPAPALLPRKAAALRLPALADLLKLLPARRRSTPEQLLQAAARREEARRRVDSLMR